MRIDAGLDTGDMLLKAETGIGPEENAVELGRRLAAMGADLLVETLEGLAAGRIAPEKQDDAQATLAPLLKKEDGAIDWTGTAQAIHNRVRGFQPWPGAQTRFRGVPLHVWKTRSGESAMASELRSDGQAGGLSHSPPGGIVSLKPLVVACGDGGGLEILEVQLEGRKRISAADFANGQRLTDNDVLGEPRV
jgi:methionyl-tRNA formyltransferase